MDIDRGIRVTLRFSAGRTTSSIDLAIPPASSLAEVLEEAAGLARAPRIDRPWQAQSAAGVPLDEHTPVGELPLPHGSIVVLSPERPRTPPVARDAAEAAADATAELGSPVDKERAAQAAALGGLGALAAAGLTVAPGWAALAATAGAAALAAMWRPGLGPVAAAGAAMAAAAAAWWVGEPAPPALLAAAGALSAWCATAWLVAGRNAARPVAFGLTAAGALAAAGGAWWLLGSTAAGGAGAIVAAVLALAAAPRLAAGAAGLTVARLPTAGQGFGDTDAEQPDGERRAIAALRAHDGLVAGAAAAGIAGLAATAWPGGLPAAALALAVGGSSLLHALRHASAAARRSLWLLGVAALVAAAASAVRADAGLAPAVAIPALALVAAPWWVPKAGRLEPTQLAWLERLEAAALVAVLPLAAWAAGAVEAVRGLG